MEPFKVLAINPGSTSTKFAVFKNEECVFLKNVIHQSTDINKYAHIADQFEFRKEIILKELLTDHIDVNSISAVVGRGGLLKPIPSGVYEVNNAMIRDLRNNPIKEHASNLGGLIAHDIAKSLPGAKAYIADPVVVDEMDDVARISGHPLFKRESIFHALNQKSIARQHAKSVGKCYNDMNLIVVHMGGGVSVGVHCKGRVIDVNQALDGEGPFSPERSGTLPAGDLVRLCFSGKYTEAEVLKMITGKGGMVAFLGTNSAYDAEQKAAQGDKQSKEILDAFVYQIAKAIGAMMTVLNGDVDAIILTGGIAHGKDLMHQIIKRVYKIAQVYIYPGEDEMRALAMNGLMVLRNEIRPEKYK